MGQNVLEPFMGGGEDSQCHKCVVSGRYDGVFEFENSGVNVIIFSLCMFH